MSEEDLGDYSFVPFTPQQSPTFPSESRQLNEFKQKVGEAEAEKKETIITEDSASKSVGPIIASDEENSASFKVDFNKAFNPGFNTFGQFGGQSAASILWGEQKDWNLQSENCCGIIINKDEALSIMTI